MSKAVVITLAVLGFLVFIALSTVGCGVAKYNSFVRMNEEVNQSWSQVQNQYQRRMDLIPNLVNTVKGVANFEKSTFVEVAQARASVNQIKLTPEMLNDSKALQSFQGAQQNLGTALSRLMVTVEKYPELKANENFKDLQAQLEGTENRITVARRKFNEVVQDYNMSIKTFPNNIISGMFGFKEKAYFEADKGAEHAPTVQF
jgi:LemA protein